jgi:thiol-disulfide isomerase/thioredoxin
LQIDDCIALSWALSLLFSSVAAAAEPNAQATLHFVNGDRMTGEPLDCGQEDAFLWQAPEFTRPLRFDGDTIAEIRFAAPAAAANGEFRFDLSHGDVLHGEVESIGDDELVVDSSRAGRVRLKRAGALRLSRCRGNPSLVYQGPTGLTGWGPPAATAAWSDDGGQLVTDRESAVLENDLALPPQALIELAVSWTAQPDFTLVLGTGGDAEARRAFRFEVLDGELIVRRETERDFDIDSVMPLARGEGRVHLLALLDQEQERLQVMSPDGKRLAAIHAADDAPRIRSGIRLEHQQGGLRLELLRVSRYSGQPPPEVNADVSRVHLTDGTVVYGNLTRYDAVERHFRLQTAEGERTIEVDQVENIFLFGAKSTKVAPQAHEAPPLFQSSARVTCVDGTRITGQFAGIREGRLQLNCPAAGEAVALAIDGLHEVRFTYPNSIVRAPAPPPFPLLQTDELKIHGRIVPGHSQESESCIAWQPAGSATSSPLRSGVSGRIALSGRITGPIEAQVGVPGAPPGAMNGRGVQRGGMAGGMGGPGVVGGRAAVRRAAQQAAAQQPVAPVEGTERSARRGEDDRDTLFLRTGDALPCRVTAIDERGVSLKSPFSDASVAPHEWVRAIEFGPQASAAVPEDKLQRLLTLPRAQKLDPPTHVIGATTGDYLRGKLVTMDENMLRFDVHGRQRELSRDRVARLVWLQRDDDEEAAAEPPAGCVQAVRLDGVRLTFTGEEVTDEWISGRSDLLGPCRVRFDQLRELLFGNRVKRAAMKLEYSWKLVDAQVPLAFRVDPATGGPAPDGADSPLVGQAAIDFELPLLDGAKFRLSQWRGKIVVLDFWASWCGPCMQGLPKVASVAAACPVEEVKLVAVNLQETSVEAADALRRLKLDIAAALDRDGKVAKEYGATSIPYTVIVGADGNVARVFVGTGPQLERQLTEALEQLRNAGK